MGFRSFKSFFEDNDPVVEQPIEEVTTRPNQEVEVSAAEQEVTETADEVAPAEQTPPEEPAVEPIPLPEDVTPADIEEVKTQVEDTIAQVEETGVTPETMKLIHMAWKDNLAMFGIQLPSVDSVKPNSINLRASASVVNALLKLKSRLAQFKC